MDNFNRLIRVTMSIKFLCGGLVLFALALPFGGSACDLAIGEQSLGEGFRVTPRPKLKLVSLRVNREIWDCRRPADLKNLSWYFRDFCSLTGVQAADRPRMKLTVEKGTVYLTFRGGPRCEIYSDPRARECIEEDGDDSKEIPLKPQRSGDIHVYDDDGALTFLLTGKDPHLAPLRRMAEFVFSISGGDAKKAEERKQRLKDSPEVLTNVYFTRRLGSLEAFKSGKTLGAVTLLGTEVVPTAWAGFKKMLAKEMMDKIAELFPDNGGSKGCFTLSKRGWCRIFRDKGRKSGVDLAKEAPSTKTFRIGESGVSVRGKRLGDPGSQQESFCPLAICRFNYN